MEITVSVVEAEAASAMSRDEDEEGLHDRKERHPELDAESGYVTPESYQ